MKPTLQRATGRHSEPGLIARTVLVVEDEGLVRETIVAELQDAGFLVLEAETAEQGLVFLDDRPVHVLFTDIRLPGAIARRAGPRPQSDPAGHLRHRLLGRGAALRPKQRVPAQALSAVVRPRRHREAHRRPHRLMWC